MAKASSLSQIGLYEDAIECYNRILKNNPLDIEVLNSKASTLSNSGNIEKAREINDKVLKLDPKNQEGLQIRNLLNRNFGV